jgi:protein-tyrosine phosphatase
MGWAGPATPVRSAEPEAPRPAVTPVNLLFVCTANQCRSPMAAGLARQALDQCGCTGVKVTSAGVIGGGIPPVELAVRAMAAFGVDIGGGRSRAVDVGMIKDADLVATMTRPQLLDVIITDPGAWPRCFTLMELVRRGAACGPRRADQPLESWIGLVGMGRQRSGLIDLPPSEDIGDPMGGSLHDFKRTRDQLAGLIGPLIRLVCPTP